MRLIDLIQKWIEKAVPAAPPLVDFLTRVKTVAPDLAGEADLILSGLGSALAPENLVSLGTDVVKELGNVATGHIDPRDHPSDGA